MVRGVAVEKHECRAAFTIHVCMNTQVETVSISCFLTHSLCFLVITAEQDEVQVDPEQIKMEARKWVRRSTVGAIAVFSAWIIWIAMFHIFEDKFSPNWFVRSEDDADRTGW